MVAVAGASEAELICRGPVAVVDTAAEEELVPRGLVDETLIE